MKTTTSLVTILALAASAVAAPATTKRNQCRSTTKDQSPKGSSAAAAPAATGEIDSGSNSTSVRATGGLTLPSGCMTKNNIAIGWLPDEDNGGTMGPITSKLNNKKACFYGLYSQVTSTNYDASQLTSRINDVKNSGAILQAAVMPTKVKFNQVDSKVAGQVCSAMKKFTDQGIEVWLRFAHEMNWYVTDGTYAGGSTQEFVTMWQNVAKACKGNDKIKMYWSPNNVGSDASKLNAWWPGADYVDVVGIDVYPKQGTNFAGAYGAFYDAFAKKYNKPFYVGETGSVAGDSAKKEWLQDLIQPGNNYPLYGGFAWFEYNKKGEGDFRVVTGNSNIAAGILE